MFRMLAGAIDHSKNSSSGEDISLEDLREIISFEECEDITARMAWCKPAKASGKPTDTPSQGLESVQEEDEFRSSMRALNLHDEELPIVTIPLNSARYLRMLQLPFSQLAEPCEKALFATGRLPHEFDDEELPLHLLVYRSLLQLPVDVRTMCMPRIVFVGGGSQLLGLKKRILDEVSALVEQYGWDPVRGKAVEQLRINQKIRRLKINNNGPFEVPEADQDNSAPKVIAALVEHERDPIAEQLHREASKGTKPVPTGFLRAVDSLGPWSGGSLLQQLKVPAVSIIDRDQWTAHGISGASRDMDVNITVPPAKRQSMGPGAFKTAAVERQSWTLGLWG